MKKLLFQLAMLCIALSLTSASCKKDPTDPLSMDDLNNTPEGLICKVGNPIGDDVTQIIGAAGGTIFSKDSVLKVIVPAGAVNSNRSFSLQTIENTLPSGIGFAFRLTPHGEQFAKPVKIQFSYKNNALIQDENTRIAYQDAKGVWQCINKAERNTVAKTVTIETTHFSDWSFFEKLWINPESATLNIGESVALKVIDLTDDDVVPLTPVVYKNAKDVSDWQLAGAGNLRPNGAEAVYTAPNIIPATNPVAVSCKVAGKSLKLLVSNIYIGGDGIFFKIDNAPDWTRATVPLGVIAASGWTIVQGPPTTNSNSAISISFAGEKGSSSWNPNTAQFLLSLPNHEQYNSTYMVGQNLLISPGTLNIHKYGKVGDYVSGSFILEKAGFWDNKALFPFIRTAKIEGFFNVKRTQ